MATPDDQKRQLQAGLGNLALETDVPLAPMTTFRIVGPADFLVRVQTPDELERAVSVARTNQIPWFLLGHGANILVADAGFRGLIIRCEIDGIEFLEDDRVRAGSGVAMYPDLINETVMRGLGGLHHFVGIPSTVGGALWQNLHFLAPDRQRTVFIEEVLESAELLTEEGTRETVGADYFEFGYDHSVLHHRSDLVLSATFALDKQSTDEIRQVVRSNLEWRDDRHPDLWLYPSVGSIFKKIEGIGAGRLIDECGLKGHTQGAAGIFHLHANIIVNHGGATASDVRALIDLARDTVAKETGYELTTEISLIGDFG